MPELETSKIPRKFFTLNPDIKCKKGKSDNEVCKLAELRTVNEDRCASVLHTPPKREALLCWTTLIKRGYVICGSLRTGKRQSIHLPLVLFLQLVTEDQCVGEISSLNVVDTESTHRHKSMHQ